jgi:hypothetical protein
MIRLLDAYAGIGGNVHLLDRNKYKITALENNPDVASLYAYLHPEDEVLLIEDAHKFIIQNIKWINENIDQIWASPPCQSHGKPGRAKRKNPVAPDMNRLLGLIVFLWDNYKGDWIVENVDPYWKDIIEIKKPIHRTKIDRHIFYSNVPLSGSSLELPNLNGSLLWNGSKETYDEWEKRVLDYLDLELPWRVRISTEYDSCKRPGAAIRNMVHPLLGKHTTKQLDRPMKTINDYLPT